MSFSQDQKKEILDQQIQTSCCKRAMLQGILSAKAVAEDKHISISVESIEVAEYIGGLVFDIYSKSAAVSTSSKGGRRRIVEFESPSAAKYIWSLTSGGATHSDKCPLCLSAYLRGLFLACGRVADPSKQFSLEFSVGGARDATISLFEDIGLTPRISEKPNETVIYFKRSSFIEDFFALAGMNNTAFSLMNAKINSEIRNNVNRITNCTTNNIDRAVAASMRQISVFEELEGRGLLSQLPDELADTARLRLEHRDMSLSQLAALTSPRVSKSGLSHRLARITQIAESILKK